LGLKKNVGYHWLTFKGTLPRNITHLKITDKKEYVSHKLSNAFIIPSSVQFIDINISSFNTLNIEMMDEKEYYGNNISFQGIDNLNSIQLNNNYRYSMPETFFSNHLQSLDLMNYKHQFNPNHLPHSLTSLMCLSPTQIPDHIQLNYLEYKITEALEPIPNIYKLIFKSNERQITKPDIPIKVNSTSSIFIPQHVFQLMSFLHL